MITAGGNAGQLSQLIRQAVTSQAPLTANPAGQARLRQETTAAAQAPVAGLALLCPPPRAGRISAKVCDFQVSASL